MAVLGAMMLGDAGAASETFATLTAADFYRDSHAAIFGVMAKLSEAGTPVDIITLKNALERQQALDGVGGIGYLMQLGDSQFTTATLPYYAEIVRDNSVRRRMIDAARLMAFSAYGEGEHAGKSAAELVDLGVAGLEAVRPVPKKLPSTLFDAIGDAKDSFDGRGDSPSGIVGIPTGFRDLDAILRGFRPGWLYILAARPSVGKSALAFQFCVNAAVGCGDHTLLFTLEMTTEEVADRIVCFESSINTQDWTSGRLPFGKRDDVEELHKLTEGTPLEIDDTTTLTMADIRAKTLAAHKRSPLRFVVIDYLGIIEKTGSKEQSDAAKLSAICTSLKALAVEIHVPVLALAQIGREADKRPDQRPLLHDLKGSGGLEESANVVMTLYRAGANDPKSYDDMTQPVELNIPKHRGGPKGLVRLEFVPPYARFQDTTPQFGDTGYTDDDEPDATGGW